MKFLLFLFLCIGSLYAQSAGNIVSTVTVNSDTALPNGEAAGGSCTNYNVTYKSNTTGHLIACVNANPLSVTNKGVWTVLTSGGGGGAATWGGISGQLTNQSDIITALGLKQNAISPFSCSSGHFAAFASNGSFTCTADSGGGGASLPVTTNLLKGNGSGNAAAASITDVTTLFSGSGLYLRKDGTTGTPSGGGATLPTTTRLLKGDNAGSAAAAAASDVVTLFNSGTCGAGYLKFDGTCDTPTAGAATVATGNGTGTRPSATGQAALFIDYSAGPGQQMQYHDPNTNTWYQLGLISGNLSYDSAGRLDTSNNVPLLGSANTFGSGLQTIPNAKITTCVQGDGTTPCFGAGSNTLAIQQNTTGQGNASTLNFGNGITASTSAGTSNITAAVWGVNGQTGNVSILPGLSSDSVGMAYVGHDPSATYFTITNSNASSSGPHNWNQAYYSGGDFCMTDDTSSNITSCQSVHRFAVGGLLNFANTDAAAATTSCSVDGDRGNARFLNGGAGNDAFQVCMKSGGTIAWVTK
jgi:hypothetical protein